MSCRKHLLQLVQSSVDKQEHAMAFFKSSLAVAVYLWHLSGVVGLPIEETDKNMLYCNFPVDAGNLQSYLSPKLKPELFEGKAWVTATGSLLKAHF